MISNKLNILIMTVTLIVLSGVNDSKASLLQLTHDPLFLTQTVPPAIAVTFDDSGSMAWGFMGQGMSNNNATYDAYSFANPAENRLYYNPNIVYSPPIQANGAELANSTATAALVDGFDAASAVVDLTTNYLPIARYYNYANGNYQLKFAKIPGTPNVTPVNNGNYNNTYPDAATRGATGRNAFYYTQNADNSYTLNEVTGAANLQNFANWYTYYNTRIKLGKTSMSRAFSTFGPSFKISWQQLNRNTNLPDLAKFETTHRTNFFNWLYAVPSDGGTPLRNAFWRAGVEFEKASSYDSVDFNTTLSCQQNFHIALSDGGWNQTFNANGATAVTFDETDFTALPGDTGVDGASANLYGAYNGTGEQKIFQKTEGRTTIADIAFHFWANDLRPALKNNVKRFKSDYTQADGTNLAFGANDDEWENGAFVWNPRNNPAYWQHMVTYNVGMGLEARAILDYIDNVAAGTTPNCPVVNTLTPREAVYRGLRKGDCEWPAADAEARRIDDVWHSSINSRGQFFSANDPQELVASLNAVVNDILERLSRGSASTVSSGVVTDSTSAYSPGFDSSNWSGNLIARPVLPGGSFGTPIFDLSCTLTGGLCPATGEFVTKQDPDDRNVYTYDSSSDDSVEFTAGSSGPAMLEFAANVLATFATGVTLAEAVDYIKGDQDNEISNTGILRDRSSVLGDIVHGSPLVVRGPNAAYLDSYWPDDTDEYSESFDANGNPDGYLKFKIEKLDRKNIVYVGSNSGMMHAVSAVGNTDTNGISEEGKELWSYIPSKSMRNLHELLKPVYEHKSFVDNTPVVTDAYINGSWRSILISGMRYGGQAFFALDVTDATASEPTVLWEFTDEDDVDMGYSYGKAQIVRISSTKEWVALIPNGYNNSAPDYTDTTDPRNRVSGSGHAVLYVVRLRDGQLLAKIDTGEGSAATPNGLATPVGVDSQFEVFSGSNKANANIDIGTDYVYAGDLYGNMWRFDFTSSNYSDWEDPSSIKRILEAERIMEQPITIQPKIITTSTPTSAHDVVVIAATGKYIEIPDRSITLPDEQYIFGIFDGPDSTDSEDVNLNNADLIEQSFQACGQANIRCASNVNFNPITEKGWKIELPAQGERVANPMALLGNDVLLATSIITAGDDPCEAGGRSWLMALNPETGGKLAVDSDGLFEVVQLDVDGNPTTTILNGDGVEILDLIIGSPPILESLGGGSISIVVEGANSTQTIALQQFTWRRRNWTNLLTE